MQKEYFTPPENPRPTGYTHAVKAGRQLFISGQAGMDADRRLVEPGDIEAQTIQALDNIGRLLAVGGASWSDVVKLNIFLTDLSHFAKVNEIMGRYFEQPYPARAAIGVAALPRGSLVEMDGILVID